MIRRIAQPLRSVLALAATSACILTLAPAATAGVAAPTARQVPAPNGLYGFSDVTDPDMMMFKVRNRKLIDPRFSIVIYCSASDGGTQELIYGPTSSDPSRRVNIPRNGSGRMNWVQTFDESLVPDADIQVNYTFRRNRSTLASVSVDAIFTDEGVDQSCSGQRAFRLSRGPLR